MTKKIIPISLDVPLEMNQRILRLLPLLGDQSRAAFIRQAINEKLGKLEAMEGL